MFFSLKCCSPSGFKSTGQGESKNNINAFFEAYEKLGNVFQQMIYKNIGK